MKKILFIALLLIGMNSCRKVAKKEVVIAPNEVNVLVNEWHKAAADADFDAYFNRMADSSIFIGTDATENWNKTAFQEFAKPYFDKGKAWNFTTLERHIYFNQDSTMAWFDELLDTQMKICRGSGVAVKENDDWKIKHYVLSMTVPNEKVDAVVTVKDSIESVLINELQSSTP